MENQKSVRKAKRRIYNWHRILGIITVIPVILWTCSGLSHPFMAHYFKVDVAHEFLKPTAINRNDLKLSLNEVVQLNHISSIRNFRLVTFKGSAYYQLKNAKNELSYFSTVSGHKLQNGEQQYAGFLARYFLGDSTAKILTVKKIADFTDDYKYVNRYLPVWKVSFDRRDKMDVYVETGQSRLANYNDTSRKVFLWVFSNFHSYEFLAKITSNTFRYTVLLFLALIVISSTVSGLVIYGLMWKKFRKPVKDGQKLGFLRRNHRAIGLAVSLVTLSFIGSGAYHATRKFTPDDRIDYVFEPEIQINQVKINALQLPLNWNLVSNLSLAKFNNKVYYQVYTFEPENGGQDSWKQRQIDKAETMSAGKKEVKKINLDYYDAATGALLPDGVMEHTYTLVKHFVAQGAADGEAACCEMMAGIAADRSAPLAIEATDYLTKFDPEYGFINKRLPVVKFKLHTPTHLAYYVEPATGRMAAKIADADRREGLSFAILHKFLLVDFAGKNFRDLFAAFCALGVLTASILGLILFIKMK